MTVHVTFVFMSMYLHNFRESLKTSDEKLRRSFAIPIGWAISLNMIINNKRVKYRVNVSQFSL